MTFFKNNFSLVRKLLICFFSLVIFSTKASAIRVGSPDDTWLMTETAHFRIMHSAQQQDLGLYYARIAEEAYANLGQVFKIQPNKITVVLNDNTDISNGYATLIPYPLIMIYPVQVGSQDGLAESGEWARELFTHELTHIMQLYPAEGFYNFLKPVFGSIIAPNLLSPTWWKEGMAVEMETQFSSQGRTRSYLQDATVRSLVADDKLKTFTLAEANETTLPSWPYGNRPYLFGSMMLSEIVADGKLSALNHIVTRQAHRFPYFIEKPHREVLNRSYSNGYQKAIDSYTQNAQNQIETLRLVPLSATEVVDDSLISSRNPRLHPTFGILGLIGTSKQRSEIIFYQPKIGQTGFDRLTFEKKTPRGDINSFDFHPTEKKIVFSRVDKKDMRNTFADLFLFDLETQTETQLTTSARAREPLFSPDGKQVLFISSANGRTELRLHDIEKKQTIGLLRFPYNRRVTSAIFLNANEILYNVRNQNGEQLQFKLDIPTKKFQMVEQDNKQVRFLKLQGQNLYFTSTNNGVLNIFESSKNFENTRPLTHLLTGVLSFDVSQQSKEIYASQITSHGLQVVRMHFPEKPIALPNIDNRIRQRYTYFEKKTPMTNAQRSEYEAGDYLWPRYWIPFIASNSSNEGLYLQAITSGHDPLDIHTYTATLSYDTFLKKLAYSVLYQNSSYHWPIDFLAQQTQQPFGSTATILERTEYALGVSPDVFAIHENLLTGVGGVYSRVDDSRLETVHVGAYAQVGYIGFSQRAFQYYPMSGWGSLLRVERFNATKNNGSFLGDYTQATATALGFVSAFLPEDHALMAKLNALYTFDNVSARFGTSSTVFPMGVDSTIPVFALRGYKNGQFFGSRLVTMTTEYRFPVTVLNKGSGTDAYFLKNITGAVVADGLAVRGAALNEAGTFDSMELSDTFWSAGLEARLHTTIGYLLPMNFVLGYYWPFSPAYSKSSQMALSLQIGGL